jgi:hypothetical protein
MNINRKPLEELALWLFMFSGIVALFIFAQFDSSWEIIRGFVISIFVAVIIIILFDWIIHKRSILNSRNIILAGVLFWILLDPLLMRKGIDEFLPEVVLLALFYVVVFIGAVLVGYSIPPYRGILRFFSRFGDVQKHTAFFSTFFVIYIISVIPIIIISHGSIDYFWRLLLAGYSPDVELGWRRGMLGDERDFLISLADLIQLSIPFLGVWILRKGHYSRVQKWTATIMVVTVLMLVYFSGSRRIFAFVILGPLFYIYLSFLPKMRRRWMVAFLAVQMFLLWLMQSQVQFRAYGFYEFDPRVVEVNIIQMQRDNNFYWLAMAVDLIPKVCDFTGEWFFIQLFIHPIPRFLWPEKPFTTGLPFISWSEAGATLSTSVVGDLYIAQGVLGIILGGLFYGWAARTWDQLQHLAVKGNILTVIYCLGLALLLLGIRSFWDIIVMWYVLGLVVLVAYYFRPRVNW